jgi:hypothetical protein
MTMERKTAVVTGASSGIGAELARIHAAHGGSLVMIARRREKLEALKAELEKTYGIAAYVLVQDLTEAGAAQQVHDHVRSLGLAVDVLVNNAGFGYWGPFHEQDWSVNEAMIKVNILALAALTRVFVPDMVARGHGRVLNVASMAGFVPGPLHAVYYASKAFVVSFSEALANELAGTGVTVTRRPSSPEHPPCETSISPGGWIPPAAWPRSVTKPCAGARPSWCRDCSTRSRPTVCCVCPPGG